MNKKTINKFLASMMMSVVLFNSAAPYCTNAGGEDHILIEESISENDDSGNSFVEDIVSEEPENETNENNISVEESEGLIVGDEEGNSVKTDYETCEIYTSGNYEYTLCNEEVTITKYIGTETEIVIPSTIDGYPVKEIGEDAFYSYSGNYNSITSIEISDGIEVLGSSCFYACNGLKSVIFGRDIKEIGDSAFGWCTEITKLSFPNGLERIGNDAFLRCDKLSELDFPSSLKEIGDSAFSCCTEITSVNLCEGLEKIGSEAFLGSQLKYVKVPSTIVELSTPQKGFADQVVYKFDSAFSKCEMLEEIEFAEGIKEIPECGVSEIEHLKKVVLPDTVTKINERAFYNDINLLSINLPNGITNIDRYAFENCVLLNKVALPEGIIEIGAGAFCSCSEITSILLPEGLRIIGEDAFKNCTEITDLELPEGLEEIGGYAFSGSQIKCVKIPSTIKNLTSMRYNPSSAFTGCKLLETIEFAEGIKEIPRCAASGIPSLKKVTLPETVIKINENAFYDDEGLKSINLHDGITYIGKGAFSGCVCLDTVIPDSITKIEQSAFYNCRALTSVLFNSCLESIESLTFYGCIGLTSLDFPNSLKEIGEDAFYGCTGLTDLDFPDSLKEIGEDAFSGCTGLTSINICEGLEKIGSNAFAGSHLTYVKIPSTILSLSSGPYTAWDYYMKSAFSGCAMLETIEFANGIVEIPMYGVAQIENLNTVILPETVIKINTGAFYKDENMAIINLPSGITSIGCDAFYGCICLGSITIPTNTIEIMPRAFFGCTGITSVSYNKGLKTIGNEAFFGCSAIHSIELPKEIEEIGYCAFGGSQLKYVKIPSSITNLSGVDSSGHSYHTDYISAFSGCSMLETIEFDEGLKTVPEYALACVESVKNIVLPQTVVQIGKRAFYGDINIHKISLPSGLKSIEDELFYKCKSLYDVTIPKSCISIGNGAFILCEALEVLVIPRSVNSIGSNPFMEDSKLVIYGYADSYAQIYANQHGIPFVVLDDEEPENGNGFDLKQHGYCFANSYEGLDHNWFYRIPLERYQEVYGDIYTRHIYDQKIGSWGGSCFGMSATAAMFLKGKLNPHDYGVPEGTTLNNGGFNDVGFDLWGNVFCRLKSDSELAKLIERYQVWAESVDYGRNKIKDFLNYGTRNENEIYEYIISKINETREPFIVIISWKDDDKTECHAVVVDSSRGTKEIDDDWTRVYLYDPNDPYISLMDNESYIGSNKRALERYLDLNTKNGQWRMEAGSNAFSGPVKIGYDNNGNLLRDSKIEFMDANDYPVNFDNKALFWDENGKISVSYRSDNVILYDSNDELLYKKENGVTVFINNEYVYDVKRVGYIDGLEKGEDEGMLILPKGKYKVTANSGMIAFVDDGDYAGVVIDDKPVTVMNNDSNSLSVYSEQNTSVNIVVMDLYRNDKYSSIQTDIVVGGEGCDVSLSDNRLSVDTKDNQSFDVDIISDEGYGEASSISSNDTKDMYLEDYLTDELQEYSITYDLDGGIVSGNNLSTYTVETETFELENPVKDGYKFIGWTGSNGDVPQICVVIGLGTKGDLIFKANWKDETSIEPSVSSNSIAMNPVPIIDETTTELHLIKGQKFTLPDTGWTSSNKKYVAISKKNVLTAKKVTAEGIKITKDGREITIYTSQPKMVNKTIKLDAGKEQMISLDYDADNLPILWYSNAPDVATISQDGMVTARTKGTATITAYIYGKAYTCKVKVAEPQIVQVRTLHVALNKNKTVSLKGIKKPIWEPEDETVVSVKGSKFKGLKAGDTIVSTEYEGKTYQIHVYVEDPTINVTELNAKGKDKYTAAMKAGDKIQLSYNFVEQDVVFKSSKGEVVYWDEGAIVAQIPGKAKLTAKVNGKTITINVTVDK